MTDDPLSARRDQLLCQFPPDIAELALSLREVILEAMPDAVERVYLGWRGIGFHHPEAGYVCGLFPTDDRVRVGFERGHLLRDAEGVLEGDGARVRYLSVTGWRPEVADTLVALLDEALALR